MSPKEQIAEMTVAATETMSTPNVTMAMCISAKKSAPTNTGTLMRASDMVNPFSARGFK